VPGSGAITPSTPHLVASGSTPAFNLSPNTGNHIVDVTGDCGGNLVGSTFTTSPVVANCSVVANFAVDTFTLTYTAGANGSLSGTTPQTVNYGASGSAVTAMPAAHYHFVQWSDSVLTATRTDTNVQANINVSAQFAIDTFTLTYTAGANGSISGATPQTVNYGASGSAVTAAPNPGYHFVKWSDNATANPRTDTNVQANIAVAASFAIDTHIVTPSVTGSGTISPNTPQSVNYASTKTFTLAPAAGNHLVGVTGSCGGSLTGNSFTTAAVIADCSVVANFAANPPILVFTTQPSSVSQGGALGSVQVTEKDSITGSVINDSASMVDFTIAACGGTIDLGSVQMSGGVAALNSTQRFYTVTGGNTLSIQAATATLNAGSATFGVIVDAGMVFNSGFEGCRL
jgi:hypothetical protein